MKVKVATCGRRRCEPGWSLQPAWSASLRDYDLWMVWAGRGQMQLTDRTIDLRPGVVFWMRPGGRYIAEQDPRNRIGATYLHFNLQNKRSQNIFPRNIPSELIDCTDIHYADAVGRRIIDLLRLQQNEVASELLRALLIDLTQTSQNLERTTPGIDRRHVEQIMQVARDIENDPAAVPLVSELAEAAGYSADHFSRIFRDVLGQSPQQYIVTARLQRSQQLLDETTMSISQIADALGYNDVFSFSAQFKRHLGISPRAYREKF